MSSLEPQIAPPDTGSEKGPPLSGLLAGFGALLALMALLASVGILQAESQQQRLETIVNERMAKLTLAARLYQSARERTVNLQKMALHGDPFERDEEWMRFNQYASDFVQAREQLIALGLSEPERALLAEQGRRTAVAVPLQQQVADLVSAGRTRQALALLAERAIPAQDAVLAILRELHALQEAAAAEAAEGARAANRRAQTWILSLALGSLAVGAAVAAGVVRRTRRATASLFRERQRALVTVHSIGDAVIRTDRDGHIEYLNPVAERLVGWRAADARGRLLAEVFRVFEDKQHERAVHPVGRVLVEGVVHSGPGDYLLVPAAGEERTVELTAAPIHDEAGAVAGAVLVFRDVTEVRALSRELVYQASHDLLTGLYNRREFEKQLHRMLGEARGGGEHALCYLDLDLFKTVNDVCGHLAGDELLRQLAAMLRLRIRRRDLLARLGGDEFGILLADCPLARAETIARQVCDAVSAFRFTWEDRQFEIGVSIGVVALDADSSPHEVLRLADLACYTAKDQGRGRVYAVQPGDRAIAVRQGEVNWLHEIRRALEDDRFCLYAQEIAPLSSRAAETRYELLIRMRDERGGIVAPMAFLPVAERYSLMPAIDRWVVREALAFLAACRAGDPDRLPHVNINLSGQSLADRVFLGFVREELGSSAVPPGHLCFEITETAAIANLAQASEFIATFKALGCRFALDDFGSGLSSLAYLKSLPVDYLKIDGVFVRDIVHSRADAGMVASVHKLAELMGIRTVAEYVENDEIRSLVASLGVDAAQGYGVDKPRPLSELAQRLGAKPTAS
jgi:diguanylate cyclase (GGDEF)-like protein/PAS domain S-box-containing protein